MSPPKSTFAPLEQLLLSVREEKLLVWSGIESRFLEAMTAFDERYATGAETTGWYQCKARYFNDLVVALLENLTGQKLALRTKRRSQLFSTIDIDVCFPAEGRPVVGGEVKALGTPPHPGNGHKARGASADLHKRAREVAFTALDLKASYAGAARIRSFQQWIEVTEPSYFSFWAMRVADSADFEKVRTTLSLLRNYCNGVGAVIYGPRSGRGAFDYEIHTVKELSIGRALREIGQRMA